jgi:hypothetical protein
VDQQRLVAGPGGPKGQDRGDGLLVRRDQAVGDFGDVVNADAQVPLVAVAFQRLDQGDRVEQGDDVAGAALGDDGVHLAEGADDQGHWLLRDKGGGDGFPAESVGEKVEAGEVTRLGHIGRQRLHVRDENDLRASEEALGLRHGEAGQMHRLVEGRDPVRLLDQRLDRGGRLRRQAEADVDRGLQPVLELSVVEARAPP